MSVAAPSRPVLFPATKFQPPRPRPEHVARERCLDLLTGPLAPRHVLISAPAGSGKSTLAAQWAAGQPRVAWVSLAPDDDEAGQFWAAVMLGIRAVAPGFASDLVSDLLAGGDLRSTLVALVGELAELGDRLALVLDDLHLIEAEDCHSGLAWLLEQAPDNVSVALCTRTDPPLPVARLVARGQLAVLRSAELGFDAAEADQFLRGRLALQLAPAEVSAIAERTDGWAAGLYLAALSLRAGVPADELIAGLDAGDRRMRGYVHTEVLSGVDAEQLRFLEEASILERFSAELCDAVLERSDSARMLGELERSNLFVIPLDVTGTWFRLHHFFGALRRERLAARDPAQIAPMHARAAVWHRAHGQIPEAIHHLVCAGRHHEAGRRLAAVQVPYLNLSRLGGAVGRWLDLLPAAVVESDAAMCISRAWVAGLSGREEEMERWLERAEALPQTGPLPDGSRSAAGQIALIRGLICDQDFGAGLVHVREAVRLESEDSPWWPLVQLILGLWGFFKDGGSDESLAALLEADRLAFETGQAQSAAIAPAVAAVILLDRGQVERAEALARRAVEMRDVFGIRRVAQTADSWWATAYVHLARGRVDEAVHDAEAGVAVTADIAPEDDTMLLRIPSRIQLARVRIAHGDPEGAREVLREARAQLERAPDPGLLMTWLEEAEAAVQPMPAAGAEELSERELTVLRMLAGTATLREIGSELFVSHNTIKSHTKAIYAKLGAAGRREAVARARELGLIP